MTKNCDCNNNLHPLCTKCVKEVCLELPYTFSVIPTDPSQTATFVDTGNSGTRWTQTQVPYSKITSFKDEDLLTFELRSSASEFDFTQNYNYLNGSTPMVLAVNPCSDTTPISLGETVTMSTLVNSTSTPVYVLSYEKFTRCAYNPATGCDVPIGSAQTVSYTIDTNTGFSIYQVDTPVQLQISINKKVGFNNLVLRLKTCGCLDVVDSIIQGDPALQVKDFFINGVFFMRYCTLASL
jgi:hypothetical protein